MAQQTDNWYIGLRKFSVGVLLILAALIMPFFREFPMEIQVFWSGVGIAIGGNILDRYKKNE